MGMLAESRSRKSIGKDPNNTKWTRDTTTFGQRILRSQGWEPGQYLGAKDAPHSELHTAANASYIRVALKDDMKGLGFNKAKEDEVTGLDVFSDLLSRLNGKSQAEVEQDQSARLVIKTNRYVEQKWGAMRFVRGGLLVGDVLEEASDKKGTPPSATTATIKTTKGDDSKRESKKRKAESLDDSSSDSSDDDEEKKKEATKKRRKEEKKAKAEKKEEKKRKREKKEKKGKLSEHVSTEASGVEDGALKKSKEDKKRSKKAKNGESEEAAEPDETSSSADDSQAKKSKKSKRDKKDKKDKKEQKEKKRRKKAAASEGQQDDESSDASPSPMTPAATGPNGNSTPVASGSGTSTPLLTQRNFVRSRFIAQKQRVLMDTEALNQILMIKT